jgi:peroxiredoxin
MQNRTVDRLLLGGIALLLIAFVAVMAQSLNEHMIKEGDTAPDFTITTDAGRTVSRANFGGKLLILNFWATWCVPCAAEIPSLDSLQRRFANQGLVVLGLSLDQDQEAYRRFLQKNAVSFQTAREADHKINVDYGTLKIPETYVIDRSGKVLKKIVGDEVWNDERVVNYVQSLL